MPLDSDLAVLRDLRPLDPAPLRASSDVAPLRRVLVHRPGSELARVTAASAADYLFDGPVAVRRAQAEHAALVDALRSGGAVVEELEDLLARSLGDARIRHEAVAALVAEEARDALGDLPPAQLARALVAGLTPGEHAAATRRLHGPGDGRWLVRPLPNLMFTRDLLAVVDDGVVRCGMRRPARRAEGAIVRAAIAPLAPARWWGDGRTVVEGGDVLLAGDGVVVVGIGERTSRAGARRLAEGLLARGAAREVIAALIPPGGPFHLDLAISMVGEDVLLADRAVVDAMPTIRHRPGRAPEPGGDLLRAIAVARERSLSVIATLPEDHGRSWDRGANVVALAPGRVIAYADNRATNRRLERAGVEVLEVPGASLGLGRGGPRCLTAPLARAAA